MEMIKAQHAGFCFGVQRAVDRVFSLLHERQDAHIYTLGDLIHNPHITARLSQGGVRSIGPDSLDTVLEQARAGKPTVVVIRTHGVERTLDEKLRRAAQTMPSLAVVDCTCPFVKKIHTIAQRESAVPNTVGFIFGDPLHPEVVGIRSAFSCPTYVFPDSTAVAQFFDSPEFDKIAQKRVVFVSQTTQKLSDYNKSQKILKKHCTNPIIFDTICSVTENRQQETEEISRNVDVMLVIGGKDSSNTQKLYDISRKHCRETYYVESVSDLPADLLRPEMKLGITAGASTPCSIIEEVIKTMTEEIKNEESFAQLLDESFKPLNIGDVVKGVITSVFQNEIHVDIGGKLTGILPFDNVTDDPTVDIPATYKVGDEIETIVTRISDQDGVATLSKKKIDNANNWKNIVEAKENGTILEGRVVSVLEKGVIMNVEGSRVFIPGSHCGLRRDTDLNALRGTTQRIKIIDINEQRRRAVGSIREVLREERDAKAEEFWANVEVGKEYEGEVKSFMPYGAFVDLGGVDGMIHTSELAWYRVNDPSEVLTLGQKIKVRVKDFDPERKRISLTYKTEESNPWNLFVEQYHEGDVVTVTIANMMSFGAFAQIIPGVDGLIHISQIADRHIATPAEVLEKGQKIDAKIIGIDYDNHKVSLSIRALLEDAGREDDAPATSESAQSEEAPAQASEEETQDAAPVSEETTENTAPADASASEEV